MGWTVRLVVLALVLAALSGCNAVGRTVFMAAVVTAHVVQATAALCAQEDVDCSGPTQRGQTIHIRETNDPYSAAIEW